MVRLLILVDGKKGGGGKPTALPGEVRDAALRGGKGRDGRFVGKLGTEKEGGREVKVPKRDREGGGEMDEQGGCVLKRGQWVLPG